MVKSMVMSLTVSIQTTSVTDGQTDKIVALLMLHDTSTALQRRNVHDDSTAMMDTCYNVVV